MVFLQGFLGKPGVQTGSDKTPCDKFSCKCRESSYKLSLVEILRCFEPICSAIETSVCFPSEISFGLLSHHHRSIPQLLSHSTLLKSVSHILLLYDSIMVCIHRARLIDLVESRMSRVVNVSIYRTARSTWKMKLNLIKLPPQLIKSRSL